MSGPSEFLDRVDDVSRTPRRRSTGTPGCGFARCTGSITRPSQAARSLLAGAAGAATCSAVASMETPLGAGSRTRPPRCLRGRRRRRQSARHRRKPMGRRSGSAASNRCARICKAYYNKLLRQIELWSPHACDQEERKHGEVPGSPPEGFVTPRRADYDVDGLEKEVASCLPFRCHAHKERWLESWVRC